MAKRGLAIGLLLLGCGSRKHTVARSTIAMLGDSTTYGTIVFGGPPADVTPASALASLLERVPESSPWRSARVVNLGVRSSTSRDWAIQYGGCGLPELPSIAARACADGASLAAEVVPSIGGAPDVALLTIGINDEGASLDTVVTVDNVARIVEQLAPVRVLVAPPFVTFGSVESHRLAIREELVRRHLLTGPDWPPLPTTDGLHLLEGSNVAVAGLWWNVLRVTAPRPSAAAPHG